MPGQHEREPAAVTPAGLDRAAAFAWRLLVVAAAGAAVLWLLVQLRPLLIALLLAMFLTALLDPLARLTRRRFGLGAGLGAALALLVGIGGLAAVAALIVPPFVSQLGDLGSSLEDGIDEVAAWLVEGPLGLTDSELDRYVDQGLEQVRDSGGAIASGLFAGAVLALELIGAALLGVIAAFFLLRDGPEIWSWIVKLFSPAARDGLNEVGRRSWDVLGAYLRGVSIVALADATLIGIALVVLGVPAALPLAVLTFFGAYIPFAGAVIAGTLAALVALVANGVGVAIVVVVVVIAVQQIEGDVLYPLVVGQQVELHPLATLIVITAGAILGGVLGAIIAIPLAAMVAQALAYSREQRAAAAPAAADSG